MAQTRRTKADQEVLALIATLGKLIIIHSLGKKISFYLKTAQLSKWGRQEPKPHVQLQFSLAKIQGSSFLSSVRESHADIVVCSSGTQFHHEQQQSTKSGVNPIKKQLYCKITEKRLICNRIDCLIIRKIIKSFTNTLAYH